MLPTAQAKAESTSCTTMLHMARNKNSLLAFIAALQFLIGEFCDPSTVPTNDPRSVTYRTLQMLLKPFDDRTFYILPLLTFTK